LESFRIWRAVVTPEIPLPIITICSIILNLPLTSVGYKCNTLITIFKNKNTPSFMLIK
jgi:hypothetical protein